MCWAHPFDPSLVIPQTFREQPYDTGPLGCATMARQIVNSVNPNVSAGIREVSEGLEMAYQRGSRREAEVGAMLPEGSCRFRHVSILSLETTVRYNSVGSSIDMDARGQANLQHLIEAVQDPSAAVLVANLIKLAVQTLGELSSIDEWIAEGMSQQQADLETSLATMVPRLRQGAFQKVHGFLNFLISQNLLERKLNPLLNRSGGDDDAAEDDFDDDIDFGFFDETPAQLRESQPFAGMNEGDIEEAFESIAEERDVSTREKMNEVRQGLQVLSHALREQLDSTEELIDQAYAAGKFEAVLREIDMGRDSLTEGLFAIVTSIFDVFRCDFQRSAFLPGYRNALQKSLMIRRALAGLSQQISEENVVVQDDTLPASMRQYAINATTRLLDDYRRKSAFQVMRWLDQLELSGLHEQTNNPFAEAVLGCEALTRYVESLSVVNQREVLIEHDKTVLEGIHQSLDSARSLVEVSVAGARPLVAEALQNATRLYGRNPILDNQLRNWRDTPPIAKTSDDLNQIINDLEERLI